MPEKTMTIPEAVKQLLKGMPGTPPSGYLPRWLLVQAMRQVIVGWVPIPRIFGLGADRRGAGFLGNKVSCPLFLIVYEGRASISGLGASISMCSLKRMKT